MITDDHISLLIFSSGFRLLATEFLTSHAFPWPQLAHLLRSKLRGIRPIEIKHPQVSEKILTEGQKRRVEPR